VRTQAQVYRRFGEADAAGTPYERVALALSRSGEALRALEALPARRRQPPLVLAALHDLALAGRAPALAAAYAAEDAAAAATAAVETLLRMTGAVAATVARRRVRTLDSGACTVLHPAVAEAARRAGADAIGLIGVGTPAGVQVDRVGIAYDDGTSLGDPSSPVRLSCRVVGDRPVPARRVPEVVARVVVDPDPVDATDADDVRWLRACVWPGRPEQSAAVEAELALLATARPLLLRGDPVEALPDAVARVPAGALPVVTTAWALSALPAGRRPGFLRRLEEAAAGRPVAWVSAEGVGVAPSVPTLGDRPASGHSIVGLALLDATGSRVEAVGRCWSRGRLLSWLAEAQEGAAGPRGAPPPPQ